ncbi:MAG: hypothetical protein Q8909_18145, partial [Bacteroidota bacterium]|nr:hypothetical protein [Bacteroidota bacterium]
TGSSLSYQTANYWSLFIQVSEKAMADSYGLTIQVGSNGTITENNAAVGNGSILTASIGGTKTFTFTPDSGYEIATLTYNGNDVKSQISNNQYTTPAINANATLSVTFKKVQYRLALKSAESGTINLLCDYGATPSFDFTPSSGWSINTVKYNGGDVTASLANGVYTVPSLTGSALLSVSFEIPTNLRSASYSSVKVYTTDNEIVVEGTEPGENVAFYTIGGAFIQSVQSKGERILLLVPQGATYLVKTDSKTVKVAL